MNSLNVVYETDTTAVLWDQLFMVRVPYSATLTETDINMFGTPTVFDKDADRRIMSAPTTIMIPIVKIIEYYKQGVNVRFVNRADVLTIYNAVQTHLEKWAKQIKSGLNVGNAPVADLVLMDEFAGKLHQFAKHDLSEISSNCSLSRNLDSIGFVDWNAIFQTKSEVVTKKTKDDENSGRLELSDVFKNAVIGLNNGYR